MDNIDNQFFKSIIDQDTASVVICDLRHTIIYMNPAACLNYSKHGGEALVGLSIFDCHNPNSVDRIKEVVAWFSQSEDNNMIHTGYNSKQNKDIYMVALRDKDKRLIGYYEKHEFRNVDQSKTYDFK